MIVLADGVFDPLHAGHLAYLDYCRSLAGAEGQVFVHLSSQEKREALQTKTDRMRVLDAVGYSCVLGSLEDALYVVRPDVVVKGWEWIDRLPAEFLAAVAAVGARVEFTPLGLRHESSTSLLQSWAARTADAGVDAFDAAAQAQTIIPWSAEANGYTLENRRAAEGRHPDILAELCKGMTVLDYGCGPGYFATMLRDRDVKVWGYDPNYKPADDTPKRIRSYLQPWYWEQYDDDRTFDVVVCREVLEHVPVREYGDILRELFRLSNRYVYITTRFTANPAHPFDLTDETSVDPSHITCLPQPFVRALCVTMGGKRCREWEEKLDWQLKGRVLVYEVTR